MTYARVNWVNSPSTTTPLSAANLNTMDAGIAAAAPLDGSAPFTGQVEIDLALGGTAHSFLKLKGTDDKTYSFYIDGSTHKLFIKNETDNSYVIAFPVTNGANLSAAGVVWYGTGQRLTVSSSAPSSPSTNDLWVDTSTIVG